MNKDSKCKRCGLCCMVGFCTNGEMGDHGQCKYLKVNEDMTTTCEVIERDLLGARGMLGYDCGLILTNDDGSDDDSLYQSYYYSRDPEETLTMLFHQQRQMSHKVLIHTELADLTEADVGILDGSRNRRVRGYGPADEEVKRLYQIYKSL